MNCDWCGELARYLVTGRRGKRRVCDGHLGRARREAGIPRTTESIELGLLEPGSGT